MKWQIIKSVILLAERFDLVNMIFSHWLRNWILKAWNFMFNTCKNMSKIKRTNKLFYNALTQEEIENISNSTKRKQMY